MDKKAVLGEAKELAVRMVDLIQHVDIADTPVRDPQSDLFRSEATYFVQQRGSREQLKRIIDRLVVKVAGNAWHMYRLDEESLKVACKLVVTAVKALVAGVSPKNRWILKHRLAVKFEDFPLAWIEDEDYVDPEDLVRPGPARPVTASEMILTDCPVEP